MPDICFYFQVHQPYRLRRYTFFDIGESAFYEDYEANRNIMLKVANKCYLPMNKLMLELIRKHEGRFKISFSISGMALEQFEEFAPEVTDSFKELVDTGCVELLNETYNHSLAFIFSAEEFKEQVQMHRRRIEEIFGVTPKAFRNTELIFNNELAQTVKELGYDIMLAEGADRLLDWRSPNYKYKSSVTDVDLMLRNYTLSDDIAFRFSNQQWPEYPLTAEKFAGWTHSINTSGEIINLFMDYETFGEHQWESTGIFEFMRAIPQALLAHPDFGFVTPSEAAEKYDAKGGLDASGYISWADAERDLTAWLGNDMQKDAIESLYQMESQIKTTKDPDLIRIWRHLQTSDHFYYMCTKWFSDGEVHKYFNPFGTPYDAYINYMNILSDLQLRADRIKISA